MKKNGILLTGAAARISQEVAILDLLISEGLEIKQDKTLLAGYSSGALNLLAMNGCFRDTSPLCWNEYYKKKILFSLRDKDVFKLFPLTGKSILNTAPFRVYLSAILNDMKFNTYGELPFKSFVITSQYSGFSTHWADNRHPGHAHLSPLDLFMASTAIPVVLPSQEINSTIKDAPRDFPEGEFIDGGTWGAFTNYNTQLEDYIKENGVLEELHILSPMRETEDDFIKTKKSFLKELEALTKLNHDHHHEFGQSFNVGFGQFLTFVKGLNELNANNQIAENIYVSIPAMNDNTGFFSFGEQESTYQQVHDWMSGDGKSQLKVPVADFIQEASKLS